MIHGGMIKSGYVVDKLEGFGGRKQTGWNVKQEARARDPTSSTPYGWTRFACHVDLPHMAPLRLGTKRISDPCDCYKCRDGPK